MENNLLKFDVMLCRRYVCTMTYRHCAAFPITEEELTAYVESRRPSLRGKPYTIAL